jgi:serine/threonine-protein kinase
MLGAAVRGQIADVFVSYKAEDRPRIEPLVTALEAEGLTVWWDAHISGGTNWRSDIEEHLDSAKCVIVAWTKRSVGIDGEFVRDEAALAKRRGTYLPVRFDDVEPPLGFREVQAISLKGWRGRPDDTRFLELIAAVQSRIRDDYSPDTARRRTDRQVSRRALIGGGAVVALGAASFGVLQLLRSSRASASIAVLPFANLSGDPAQGYFADGIADEIRSALGRLGGLTVIGTASSEAVRNDDARTAAKKLGVANILTGNVRQSSSTIRIAAELIDGRTGADRWSENYDRSPGDSIKIQTDIAANVANALSVALGAAARKAITVGGTANPDAQRLYIQASAIRKASIAQASLQKAMALLDAAVALDPTYADAYARKSAILTTYTGNYLGEKDTPAARTESVRLARTALRIAPNLALGHRALSSAYSATLQIGPAFEELRRARQLAPGDADILAAYSDFTSQLGRAEAALALAEQAIAMDPLNPGAYDERIQVLFDAHRYAQAVNYARDLQRRSPQLFISHQLVADCLSLLGRTAAAQSYYDNAAPDYWHRLTGEGILAARSGDRSTAERVLARMRQLYGDAASTQIGEIYAQLGDEDQAFAALDRAFTFRDAGLVRLRVDPFLDPIRSDRRYTQLLEKLQFPS